MHRYWSFGFDLKSFGPCNRNVIDWLLDEGCYENSVNCEIEMIAKQGRTH